MSVKNLSSLEIPSLDLYCVCIGCNEIFFNDTKFKDMLCPQGCKQILQNFNSLNDAMQFVNGRKALLLLHTKEEITLNTTWDR